MYFNHKKSIKKQEKYVNSQMRLKKCCQIVNFKSILTNTFKTEGVKMKY